MAEFFSKKSSSKSGTMIGPGSSVDENVMVFDGTSGEQAKDSGVSINEVVKKTGTLTANQIPVVDSDGVIKSSSNLIYSSGVFSFIGTLGSTGARITKAFLTDLEITNLPTIAGTIISQVVETLTNKTIDADNNTITNIGASEVKSDIITGQANKATPVGTDKLLISSTADSGNLKEINIEDLPATGVTAEEARLIALIYG